jgi:cob(I)alamin adenosyltransferase
MRITKVYTKTGDKGKTRLAGGQEVWKDSLRVEAYGTVDELNASLGAVCALWWVEISRPSFAEIARELRWMQHKLFDIGGVLATVPGQSFPNMPSIKAGDVTHLEKLVDGWQENLHPLKEFILPGGGAIASALHLTRTVCRRAERRCVSLMHQETVDQALIMFLNRLSDALFVLARWVTHQLGEQEILWERTTSQPPD